MSRGETFRNRAEFGKRKNPKAQVAPPLSACIPVQEEFP
jgi:hypothetical protein